MEAVKKFIQNWGVVALVAAGFAAFVPFLDRFETVQASEQKWAQHNLAIACRTVYELEKEVRSYLDRLRFDKSLTAEDREWIDREIKALKEEIARIDPNGQC